MPENKGVQYKIVINGRESIKNVPADKVSIFEKNAKAKGYTYKKIEPVPAPKPAPAPASSQEQVSTPDSNNNATKELKLGNIPQQDSLPNSALYNAPSPIKKVVYDNSINPSFGNAPKKAIQDYNNTQNKEYSPVPIEPQKQGQTFSETLKENQDKVNPTPQREYSNENMATIQAGEIINPNEPLYQEMVTNNPEVLKTEQEYERTKGKFMGAGSEIEAKQAYEKAKDDAYNAYISKKNEDKSQDSPQGNGQRGEYIQPPSYDRVEVDGEIKYIPKGSAFDTDADNATKWNSRVARNVENKEIVAENTRQEFETTLADDSVADNKKRDELRRLAGSIYMNQEKRLEKLYNTGQINDATKSYLMNKSARAYKKLQNDGNYTFGNAFTTDRIINIGTAGAYGLVKSVADVLAYGDIEGNDRKVYSDVIDMFTNADEKTRDSSYAYDVVSGALESIPYMTQMGYSFGVGTALQASTKATSKGIAKYLLSKGLSKGALKNTNKIANGIVQATVFSAISPETYKGVIEDGREQFGADFTFNDITGGMILRNFAQSSMTALIERSGRVMNKLVLKQYVTNLQAQTPQVIRKVISSTGALQGIAPEFMEEKLEELSNIVVWNEGTWEQFFNPQQNLVTLGVCGLLQSPAIAAQTNNIARNKYKSSRNLGIVSAYDKRIADKLKQASRIENPDERMKAYASSGITSIQSIEGQKAAVAYVLHKEAVINQRLLIREEMGENIKSQITLNITRMGLSYKNSEDRDIIHQAITRDNNGTQRMFYVLGSSVGGLVPVKEVIDGNISPKKTFVSEKLFEESEQIEDDVLYYIDQAVLRLTEQEKARFAEEDNKAEAMDTKIEQENAQSMQNVINDVQEEEANVLESLEDNEIRQGTIVYDKYDTKEERTELEVINVDGEQAEVRLENGKTVLLPVEELGVIMQTTPNAQELSMQAIEESNSETASETASEINQADTKTDTKPTLGTVDNQVNTENPDKKPTSEPIPENNSEEVDVYADFPRTKQGEIDINKLSPEQTIIYAENELGKEFAVKQVKQTYDKLTVRRDSLIKKMAKQSIKEAIKTKKQIETLEHEIDTYSIYLNDNNVLGIIPQEDLSTKTKTREERLAYVEDIAEATPRGYLLRGIATGEFKFVWGGERGVAAELGFFLKNKRNKKGEKVSSAGEMRSRISILSKKGFTPDTLGEYLADRFDGMIDALDARSLVIEVLNEVTNQREALEALENSFVERDDYMRRYEEEELERIALEEAEREELEITIKAYYESSYNGLLKELDEEHAKLAEYASQINVPQELIENAYSTFDLITLIEEYGNNEQENSNERGSDASNGISSSEREISERDRGGIKETELNSRRNTISESETKSDSENGLQEIQADNIEKGIDYDNNREQGLDKVSGEEQSREANEVLEQSEPQTSGGLDRSRTTESQAPVSESNIQRSSDALSSEATSQEADNARGDRETKTKSTTESNTNDDLLHFSSEEVQVIDSLNEFVSKNKLTTKARFIHSNSKEFAEKTKRIPENNKKGVTGWYNQSTNEVIIVLDNLTGDKLNEAKKTYLHEVIGHQSLYNALGKEAHTELMNDIYNVIPKIYKAKFNKDNGQAFREQLLEEGVSQENLDAEYNKRVDEIIAKQVESELAQYNGNITEYADEFFAYNAENINLDQDTKKSLIDTIKSFIERIFGIHSNDDFIQGLIDTAINYNINQDKIEAQKKVDRFKALVDKKIDKNAGSKVELAKEESKVDINPSETQKEAGNYQKGHVKLFGFDITIENPKGSVRKGVDENGRAWESKMNNTYGYIKGTKGYDGDQVDIYIGDNLNSTKVFVIDQVSNGIFDEHKVMLGFDTEQEAKDNYLANYEEGWEGLGTITETSLEEFSDWVMNGTKKQKPFSDYSINKDTKDVRFRNIESIKDRNRQVLRIDEYGKNIVWENGDYYIAVDSKDDARYISLWYDNKKIGFLTAQKGLDRIDGINPDDILLVGKVEIDKKHRGNGLSKPMYKALIDFSANNIKAIASYLPDRVNKKQVPNIWNSFGVEIEDDYDYIRFREKQIKSEAITNGTFMKAPNGEPTNLTEKQWLQVRTPEFKAWFGDWENSPETASKVIDENGEPLVVYHGSPNGEISTFDWNNGNGKLLNRGALYFSPYSNVSKNYAGKSASAKVYPVFLNVKNIKEFNDYISIGTINTEIAKQINENGFDGAHYKPTNEDINNPRSSLSKENEEYVAFFPNQIKSATDNNGEFNSENEDIRFREVPTNKNFVALHNIPEWKLARVLKQGGFVNPSVAVTIPEIAPFESYGEISFIAPKRLIDKKTGKNAGTFLGDAYTPRYPHVEYDISSRNIGKLNDRIYKNEILKKYNLSSFVSSRILSDVREKGIDEIQLSLAVKLLFLAEQGIDIIQVEKRKYSDNELKELKDLGFANKDIHEIKDNKEDKEVLTKLWEGKNKDKYEDFEDAKQKLYEDGNVPILIMRDMLIEIKSEINSPVRANFSDNLSHANRYIIDNNLNQEAEKFAYDLYDSLDVKEQIFDGFTPTGKRRYLANTIQNASKLMKKEGLEGAEGWNYGLGSLRALVAPKLTSTDKIAKFRSLIVSEDEFETIKVDLEDVYDNISNELRGENGGWGTGNYRLAEVINLSNPSEYLKKEYDLEISDELNNQIKEFRTQLLSMPTEYFETKFQRPVYVAEFSGVLIPSNASEEVKAALNKIGIKVKEYSEDTERQTKLNELIDDLEASEQIRFRNNKQFQDEQRNTQKISNKTYANFNLNEEIRFRAVYHGSPHAFDRFSLDHIGNGEGQQAYGWGLYFTDKESIAREYAKNNQRWEIGGKSYQDFIMDMDSDSFEFIKNWYKYDNYNPIQIKESLEYWVNQKGESHIKTAEKALSYFDGKEIKEVSNRNLYKVKIHGDKDVDDLNFMRWDKPVTDKFKTLIYNKAREEKLSLSAKDWSGKSDMFESGKILYDKLFRMLNSDKEASLFLLRAGIDGIQYPTEYQSKGEHENSYNFVVFDENAVEIEEHIRFRLGNKARNTYDDILKTKRTDLTEESRNTFLEYLDTIDDKKKEKVTFNWFAKGTIIVPEDMYKVEQAIKVADIKKIDPMQFNSPMEIIDKFSDVKIKGDRINPDNVNTLSNKVDYGNGITVYDVEESEQGRKDMREIINTHFGEKSSPWCLLQGNEKGELTEESSQYWFNTYNKIQKRVAFNNGKLIAFSANSSNSVRWWDRNDESSGGIPIIGKIPNDKLGRSGRMIFNEEEKTFSRPYNIYKGNKMNGVYEEWSDYGEQLILKQHYKDGVLHGKAEEWHDNGNKKEEYHCYKGELDGEMKEWYRNGQLAKLCFFKKGSFIGKYTTWYENGQLKTDRFVDEDIPNGKDRYYLEDGKLIGETVYVTEDGIRKETEKAWHENGQLSKEAYYENHVQVGHEKRWTKDGELLSDKYYKDGSIVYKEEYSPSTKHLWYRADYSGEGDYKEEFFNPDGSIFIRRNYKSRKLNGLEEMWDDNGELTSSKIYEDGDLVKDNLANEDDVRFRLREKPAPKNTIKAYKLFRTDNKGNLYTLFIDNNVPLKIGSWYDADSPQMDVLSKLPHTEGEKEIYLINKDNTFELWRGNTKLPKINEVNNASISQARYIQVSDGKNGRMYHNVGINGANGVSLYAMRAGLHSTNVPSAHHIGKGRAGAKAVYRPDNQVWAEIEVSADVNYQDEALSNAPIVTSKSSANYGKPNMAMAQITDKIPIDGYYIYQTNANANKAQDWIISGAMKINKVLDDNTTKKIARDLGFDEDLPRVQEKVNRFNELLNGESNIRYRTINIDGVERPTVNSLGEPIASTEEGLRNFWKWFGDSEVIDSEGLPLVVYHGTDKEFNVFTKKDIGFHFGTKKQANSRLSTLVNNSVKFDGLDRTEVKSKTRKLPVYLKIENILETKDYGNWHNPQSVLEKLVAENIITKKEAWKVINSFPEDRIYATSKENQEYVTKYLQSKGYDGIKYINKYEAAKEKAHSYIVFESNQIKSIDNIGTFDPENNDIRFREVKDLDKALYTINKEAKKIRDAKRNLYEYFKYGESIYKETSDLLNIAINENGEFELEDSFGKAFTSLSDIEDEIKSITYEIDVLEDKEKDEDIEEEIEFYKDALIDANQIKEKFLWVEKDAMDYLSKKQNDLYEKKENVINKVSPLIEGYHVFSGGDIRPLYKIGDFSFHGKEVSQEDLPSGIDVDELELIEEISSDNKLEGNLSVDNALDIVDKYLADEDIRFRKNNPIQSKIDLFNDLLNPEESNTKKAISKLEANKDKINELAKKAEINYFNKIKPLDEINKIIAKEDLYKRYDVYRETSNYISRVHAKSEKFNETLGQKYIESMAKIKEKTGFSYEEIGDYHMAIYMPEYTAKILQSKIDNDSYITNWRSELDALKENDSGDTSKKKKYLQNKIEERINVIKEKYKDGLAGEKGFAEDLKKRGFSFTTPEEYVEYFENIVDDNALIEELKASLRDINQFSLRIGYETGQISKEQYEDFRSNRNYVPLRGWSKTFDDSGEANPFQMLNMTGKGRKSKASNPINYIFAQAYTVINFGEINEVKRKLAKLALMNSSNEAFKELFGYNEMYEGNILNAEGKVEPFRAYSKEEFDQLQGVIEDGLIIRRSKEKYDNKQRQINPHKYSEEYQKHILVFYDKGVRHELYIEDKRIVESFKSDSVSKAFTKLRKLTSMMTRLMTSRNLSFIVPNLIRDLGSALLLNNYSNNPKEDMRFKKEIMQNMAKYTPMVWNGIWKHDWDSQTMELYNNWELDGGKTGWLQTFKNIADLGKDIEKRLNKNNKEKILMDLVKLKPIENLAEFSESIIRFATYIAALKNGYTRADAAFMSNDVSLNYNLKGKKGNWLKSVYGLFNAAIAGTYKVYNFAKTNPKQFAAATFGLMLAGYGQWWLSELLDDDKDKRSEYRRQRMISLFGISMPISYDLVPVFRAGYLIAEYLHGDKMSDTEFAYELMMSPAEIVPTQVQSAFSFLVNYDKDIDRLRYLNWEYLSELSPTILSPITDVVVNRDFMGRDIVKESKFLDIPNSANYDEYKVTNFDKLAAFVVNGIDQFDWRNHDERSKFTSKGDERIIDVSPAHVNHILRGYLSGVYQTFAGTIEAVDMLTDDKPNDANKLAGKLPVINRFYIGTNENIPVYKTIEVLDRKFGTIIERATEKRRLVRDKSLSESEREKYREEFYKIVNTPEFEKARIYEREKKEIYSLMKSIRFAANLNDKEKENKLRQELSVKLLEFKN